MWALAVQDLDALSLGLGDLLRIGGDLLGGLEGDDGHVQHAGPDRGTGDVERGGHAAPGVVRRAGLRRRGGRLGALRIAGLGAQRGAGRIEGHVPAADDDDALAEVDAVAPVDVEEELDGAQDAVELVAG